MYICLRFFFNLKPTSTPGSQWSTNIFAIKNIHWFSLSDGLFSYYKSVKGDYKYVVSLLDEKVGDSKEAKVRMCVDFDLPTSSSTLSSAQSSWLGGRYVFKSLCTRVYLSYLHFSVFLCCNLVWFLLTVMSLTFHFGNRNKCDNLL